MQNRQIKTILLVFAALVVAFPVLAQSQNTPSVRLDRLEREMQTLSRSVFKGDVPPPQIGNGSSNAGNNAAMEVRFNQLEGQLQALTGQIEQQGHQIRQLENQLKNSSISSNVDESLEKNAIKTIQRERQILRQS
jgi:TolA-binding protein